jgi:hypothetical protein
MDGNRSEYPQYFSQSSSQVDPSASAPSFLPNVGNFDLFS